MVRRKDSMSYMELLRGKYEMSDPTYIHRLVENMTQDEQHRFVEMPFLNLWTQLWGNGRDTHSPEFYDAKEKFDALDRSRIVCDHRSPWTEPEWGFPKGRKKIRENDIDCAVREFCEETQLYNDDIQIAKDINPFQEIFFGTNNILYKHVYYIAKIVKEKSKIFLDNNCIEQVREVRDIKWLTYTEVLSHIKYHNIERIEIFKKAHTIITDSLLL
jgi:8-oxo-dGTP pyrophosphatase MutT (NUDIX family)